VIALPAVAVPGAETAKCVAPVTVSTEAGDVTVPCFAVMFDVPGVTPCASPPVVMVATVVVAEAHVTTLVRFCVEESL
jgi:hypothetical protein